MIEIILTLRAVSGFWTPAKQKACANTDLKIKLLETPLIRGQAVLFFNGAAFVMENNDAEGEQQMLAEREVFKQSADNYAELQKAYEEEKAAKLRLAEEIIRQGQIIAEMQKDIEALKNEQQI